MIKRTWSSGKRRKDIIGNKYGRLLVESFAYINTSGQSYWNCRCDCGNIKTIRSSHLKSGSVQSCGCLASELASKRAQKIFVGKGYNIKHGGTKTRLYRIWAGMKQRCNYKKAINYNLYGARGVTVCDEWLNDFGIFRDWALSHGYDDSLTIDRISNDMGYFPENCKWSTRSEQQNNRRCAHIVVHNGIKKTITEWCEKTGVPRNTVYTRIIHGWNPEIAIIKPPQRKERVI